jgi:hypothetical protein
MHDHQPNCLRWTAHPARERPGRAALGVAIIAGIAAAAYLSFGWEWSVASALILILSLNRFFLPSRFELDNDRIVARNPLRSRTLHWRDVRRFVSDADGGFLSTRSRRSFMDPSSGMHLLFGGDEAQRHQIIQCIRARIGEGASTVRSGEGDSTLRAEPDAERRTTQQPHAIATGGSACRK